MYTFFRVLDTDYLKMALRARKVSGAFEKLSPEQYYPRLLDLFLFCLKVCVHKFIEYAKSVLEIKVGQTVLVLLSMCLFLLAELQEMAWFNRTSQAKICMEMCTEFRIARFMRRNSKLTNNQ